MRDAKVIDLASLVLLKLQRVLRYLSYVQPYEQLLSSLPVFEKAYLRTPQSSQRQSEICLFFIGFNSKGFTKNNHKILMLPK